MFDCVILKGYFFVHVPSGCFPTLPEQPTRYPQWRRFFFETETAKINQHAESVASLAGRSLSTCNPPILIRPIN